MTRNDLICFLESKGFYHSVGNSTMTKGFNSFLLYPDRFSYAAYGSLVISMPYESLSIVKDRLQVTMPFGTEL